MAEEEARYLISNVIHPGLVSESEEINLNIDAEHVYVKIKEGDDEKYVPLSVIIQNYSNYTDNARLTTIGPSVPSNPRMEIWIDTDDRYENGYNLIKLASETELGEYSGSNTQVGDNG